MNSDSPIRDYLLSRLREIGAVLVSSGSETITISTTVLSSDNIARQLNTMPTVVSQDPVAYVRRERLINLEDYEHDSIELRRPVPNTPEAICAEIRSMDGLLDKWELKAKASCTKRRMQAREEDRRIEQEARLAEEQKMVETRAKVLALISEHPDWTTAQICTELGDHEYRGRDALHQLVQEGAIIRDHEKGVWRFPEEDKEEQSEQSDPVSF